MDFDWEFDSFLAVRRERQATEDFKNTRNDSFRLIA